MPDGHLRMRPGDFQSVDFLALEGVMELSAIVTATDMIPHMTITWFDRPAEGENGTGWRNDGCYYFSSDDLDPHVHHRLHVGARQGKPLHLFTRHWAGRAQTTRYVDEFVVDDIEETVIDPARPRERPRLTYKLRPMESVAHLPGQLGRDCDPSVVSLTPIERSDLLDPEVDLEHLIGVRDENLLVAQFCRHLRGKNHSVQRLQLRHTAGHKPLFTDIWVDTAFLLIEAKVRPDRDSIRQAIGQMADYTRFLPNPRRAILLSARPTDDLIGLAHSERCALIWPSAAGVGWSTSAAWLSNLTAWPEGKLGEWMRRFSSVVNPR
ncbi:hypothetical protein NOVA_27300 [Nocardia nova]|uniref:hypothetical protein n=1 Tax=Nocardia nova TaxID=37330 RepID=UPI001C472874|nr:hypothetical protein [Nocardia nova]MBV7706498.1 hypothetical protein [Nocardia nova]